PPTPPPSPPRPPSDPEETRREEQRDPGDGRQDRGNGERAPQHEPDLVVRHPVEPGAVEGRPSEQREGRVGPPGGRIEGHVAEDRSEEHTSELQSPDHL